MTDQASYGITQRGAGVLLHPSSFPGEFEQGDIGHQAYRFIEFLSKAGFKVWQMLPLGPTLEDKSPYQCLSAHAGNSLLISLDWLEDKSWLDRGVFKREANENDEHYRLNCLQLAAETFYSNADAVWLEKLDDFCDKHKFWLDDYVLYMAFKKKYDNKAWFQWPTEIRSRNKDALAQAKIELEDSIKLKTFEQFVFFTQWQEIHDYAKKFSITLFGDIPIFVGLDSADVWAEKENFLVDEVGNMPVVSGVPPDAFSDTGQRWGNPLYDWEYLQSNDFMWWKNRFKTQLELFDLIRIDHFRGLQACWQIAAHEETAMNGSWVEVPGKELLEELLRFFPKLPLVAEDLGIITDEVTALKEHFDLPGMKVLQFAFDGNNNNPHLPHLHKANDVVYTGTHDNDTSLGWVSNSYNYNTSYFEHYLDLAKEQDKDKTLALIRTALASVSVLAVLPMQDLLLLDSSARMNMPGTVGNNWLWRFDWDQVDPLIIEKISQFINIYQR